jgi:hypothetical protein
MKVINKILKAHEEGRPSWSFEYFPPKTQQVYINLILYYSINLSHIMKAAKQFTSDVEYLNLNKTRKCVRMSFPFYTNSKYKL